MELKEHFPTGHKTLNPFSLQQHTHTRTETHTRTRMHAHTRIPSRKLPPALVSSFIAQSHMPTFQPLAHINEVSVYMTDFLWWLHYLSDTVTNNWDNLEGKVLFLKTDKFHDHLALRLWACTVHHGRSTWQRRPVHPVLARRRREMGRWGFVAEKTCLPCDTCVTPWWPGGRERQKYGNSWQRRSVHPVMARKQRGLGWREGPDIAFKSIDPTNITSLL